MLFSVALSGCIDVYRVLILAKETVSGSVNDLDVVSLCSFL